MEEIVRKIAEQFLEEGAKKVIEIKRKNEYKNLLKGLFKKSLPLDRDLNIGLDKVYVEPFYKKPLERENSQSLKINLWDLLEQQENQTKFLLVLGQPGSGKSSLVKKLTSEWAEKNREPYPKEIFKYKLYVVQLRNLPEEFKEKPIEVLEKYLKSELGEAYKPYLWGEEVSYPFEGFNESILLLDGLDEFVMNYNLSEEEVKNLLEGLHDGLKNPQCYVLITSRPNYLSKETLKDLNKRLDFKVLEIADLNEEQIKTFLEKYKEALEEAIEEKRRQGDKAKNVYLDRYEELLEKINNLPQERKNLVSQPLLLYMVSHLYLRNETKIYLQGNEIDIYQKLIDSVIKRVWENNNHLRKVIPNDKWKELYKKFLEELAFLIEFSSKDYATLAEIEKLKSFKELKGLTKKPAKELLGTLLTFFYFRGNSSDNKTQTVEFIHKTFQEYLAAKYILTKLLEIGEKTSEDNYKISQAEAEEILEQIFAPRVLPSRIATYLVNLIEKFSQEEKEKLTQSFNRLAFKIFPALLEKDFIVTPLKGEKGALDRPLLFFGQLWNLLKKMQKYVESNPQSIIKSWNNRPLKENFIIILKRYSLNFFFHRRNPYISLLNLLNPLIQILLEKEELSKSNLELANFSRANLKNSKFIESYFILANLKSAKLIKANLMKANLMLANLKFAKLIKANLKFTTLIKANLSEANLIKADLTGANLTDANLEGADLRGAIFDVEQIKKAKNWDKAIYDPEVAKKLGLENRKKAN